MKRVVSNFYDLYIGDIAFLATILGMESSEACYCLLCTLGASQFNCDLEDCVSKRRTIQNMYASLIKYLHKSRTSVSLKNVDGVNNFPLIPVDVTKVIVPILHCPMGLVDKLISSFLDYVWQKVLLLPADDDLIRQKLQDTCVQLASSIALLRHVKFVYDESKTPVNKQEVKRVQVEKNKAVEERARANKAYEKMIRSHSRRAGSFTTRLEATYRALGISREYYHGGKFNGVNCIRIMEQSTNIFDNATTLLLEMRDPALETVENIQQTSENYSKLLGCLDAIWANVHGLESGLLPSDDQLAFLETAISEGKKRWLELGLSTKQPKWHLTFDGHLLHCVKLFGGLADKDDAVIEKGHQEWTRLQERFCRIRNFEKRQTCIMRAWRQRRHHSIISAIEEFESKRPKHKADTERKRKADGVKAEEKESKKVKRESFVNDD